MPKRRARPLKSTGLRWTATEARAVLAELEASGLSTAAFAEREGLDVHRLYRWRRRIPRPAEVLAESPRFIEVRRPGAGPVEVLLRSGRVLRIPESIDTAALRRIADALEDPRVC